VVRAATSLWRLSLDLRTLLAGAMGFGRRPPTWRRTMGAGVRALIGVAGGQVGHDGAAARQISAVRQRWRRQYATPHSSVVRKLTMQLVVTP